MMRSMALLRGVVMVAGMLQLPSAPPVRVGLWESVSRMTLTMPGVKMPERPPVVTRTRSCVTAAGWAQGFAKEGRAASCVRSHEKFADGRLSFDLTCPNQNGKGHGEIQFGGDVARGTVHLEMNVAGHVLTSQTAIESKFVGASCGEVLPGAPKVMP